MARPSEFNQEIADKICERLIEGDSLRELSRDEGFPSAGTILRWVARYPEFQKQYAHAREAQADALFDEILDIADDGSNDWMERNGKDDEPGWQFNGEAARRSQIRIDARKWMAGKMRPKKYGDKLEIDANVSADVKVTIGGDA